MAHLGGGITLSLYSGGRIIDMISDDEGLFHLRAGIIPSFKLARIAFEEGMTYDKLMRLLQRGRIDVSLWNHRCPSCSKEG